MGSQTSAGPRQLLTKQTLLPSAGFSTRTSLLSGLTSNTLAAKPRQNPNPDPFRGIEWTGSTRSDVTPASGGARQICVVRAGPAAVESQTLLREEGVVNMTSAK